MQSSNYKLGIGAHIIVKHTRNWKHIIKAKVKRISVKESTIILEVQIDEMHFFAYSKVLTKTSTMVSWYRKLTVLRVPFIWMNLPSSEMNFERSLKMQSSKSTVLPLPVGAEITMFASEWKQTGKHSLCSELKYLHV